MIKTGRRRKMRLHLAQIERLRIFNKETNQMTDDLPIRLITQRQPSTRDGDTFDGSMCVISPGAVQPGESGETDMAILAAENEGLAQLTN